MATGDELTRDERILLYLYSLPGKDEGIDASEHRTQRGIADAVGFKRTHATRALSPLIDSGFVIKRKCHITGTPMNRKMWAYFLTEEGRMEARKVMHRYGISVDKLHALFHREVPEGAESVDVRDVMSRYGLNEASASALVSICGGNMGVIEAVLSVSYEEEKGMTEEEVYLYRYMRLREEGRI